MCMFSSPSPPPAPPPPPPPPEPPKETDERVRKSRLDERRRAMLAGGRQSTILTGPGGLSDPPDTAEKTLLGQ